jgi:hypothetical protein
MNRIATVIAFALLSGFVSGAAAQAPTPAPAAAPAATASPVPVLTPRIAEPVTQNTISTTGPVTSSTTISAGTLAGQVLMWISVVAVPVISKFIVAWLIALAKKAGVETSQVMSERLDQMIENGLHSGASTAQADLTGKLNIDVKNDVIRSAVQYAQTHAVDTIKNLTGADPTDPKVIETLQARATKVLASIGPNAPAQAAAPVPSVVNRS